MQVCYSCVYVSEEGVYFRRTQIDRQSEDGPLFEYTYWTSQSIVGVCVCVCVSQQGASNAYQHMVLWRNKKNISTFGLKKVPNLEL